VPQSGKIQQNCWRIRKLWMMMPYFVPSKHKNLYFYTWFNSSLYAWTCFSYIMSFPNLNCRWVTVMFDRYIDFLFPSPVFSYHYYSVALIKDSICMLIVSWCWFELNATKLTCFFFHAPTNWCQGRNRQNWSFWSKLNIEVNR
jgi:hypothetical protein